MSEKEKTLDMPSICNGSSAAPVVQTPAETDLPFTKTLITYLEKRTRNLDKRKAKLDGYLEKEKAGAKLEKDQQEALKNLPAVVGMIECLKETSDYITKCITDEGKRAEKEQRKLAKRQQTETHKQTVTLLSQLLQLQGMMELFKDDSVKDDFKTGIKGAVVLTDDELGKLNLLRQMISPSQRNTTSSGVLYEDEAENVISYFQGKEGFYGECDFSVFREIVQRVVDSGYFSSQKTKKAEKSSVGQNGNAVPLEAKEVKEPVKTTTTEADCVAETESSTQATPLCTPAPAAEKPSQEITPNDETLPHNSVVAAPPTVTQIPLRAVKEPQEILSAVRGSYNFLQESEIDDEPEQPVTSVQNCGFSTFEPFVQLPHGYSVAPSHGVIADSHQLLVQQPVSFSGHLMTLSYPQNLVSESVYMAHGLPVGYSNGIAMTTPFTMHDAYSQPIVSHDLNNIMIPTTAFYDMGGSIVLGQQEASDPLDYEETSVSQQEATESAVSQEETNVSDSPHDVELHSDEAGFTEPEKKKFSMNPNADVFRSKNFPDSEGDPASETAQGGYGGRRNGRGGRGGRGSHGGYQGRGIGHRGGGQNYNSRGGFQRYPRNDYRQDGQNAGYGSDYNGWQRRDRGGRGGNPRGGAGRGGRGGYDRPVSQNAGQETPE